MKFNCDDFEVEAVDREASQQVVRYLQLVNKSMGKLQRYMIPTPDGEPYMERFVLHRDGRHGAGTYLHVIFESDGDRDPHDHPYDFSSQIIWGGYREDGYARYCQACDLYNYDDVVSCTRCGSPKLQARAVQCKIFKAGDVNDRKAHSLHRLTLLDGPAVTLVTRGPKIREWGFQTMDGWVGHEAYVEHKIPAARPTEV